MCHRSHIKRDNVTPVTHPGPMTGSPPTSRRQVGRTSFFANLKTDPGIAEAGKTRPSPFFSETVLLPRIVTKADRVELGEGCQEGDLDHAGRAADLDRAVHGGAVAHLGHGHVEQRRRAG